MNKALLRIVLAVLVCSMIAVLPGVSVSAAEKEKILNADPELISYIEDLAASSSAALGSPEKTEFTVIEVYTLKKFSSSDTYTMFIFEEGGHAVYDNATGIVDELYVENSGIEDKLSLGKEYYYGGPGVVLFEENGDYYNLSTNFKVSEYDVEIVSFYERAIDRSVPRLEKDQIARGPVRPETSTERLLDDVSYFFALNSDDQFGNGYVGNDLHIAVAIMLGYYDYFGIYPGLVPANYHYMENGVRKEGTANSYITKVQSMIGTNTNSIPTAAINLNSHFDTFGDVIFELNPSNRCGAAYSGGSVSLVLRSVENEINRNRPAVVSLQGAPISRKVVVYGYKETVSSGVTATYYVQTGTENPLRAAYSYLWFDNCMFLDENPTNW